MKITHVYSIMNTTSGEDLGGYEADDEQGALDAMAQDAGYEDYAHLQREVPARRGEIMVRLESVVS